MDAERLLEASPRNLKLADTELRAMKAASLEKQAVAWWLKRRPAVPAVWIADRLGMGRRTSASRALSNFDRQPHSLDQKELHLPFELTGR